MICGQVTFPRNYSLFINKNKTKAIDFNPKCIFLIKEVHILTVSTLQNLPIFLFLHHVSIQVYLFTAKTRG